MQNDKRRCARLDIIIGWDTYIANEQTAQAARCAKIGRLVD